MEFIKEVGAYYLLLILSLLLISKRGWFILENRDEVKIQSTSILSDGYGLYPRLVARDTGLTIEAKAIYAYLISFAGNSNTCFPSRDLITSELGISKDRFYKHMKLLKDKGYIKVHKNKDGTNFSNNVYEIILDKRDLPCPDFKDTENKDTNNNSFNNNKNIYVYKEQEEKEKEFINLYKSNIGIINELVEEQLKKWALVLEVKLFKRALEICTERNNINFGYLKGIIKKWLNANITTLEELEAQKLKVSIKNKSNNKSIPKSEENIPNKKLNPKVHNFPGSANFSKYEADELERILLESQRGKFN